MFIELVQLQLGDYEIQVSLHIPESLVYFVVLVFESNGVSMHKLFQHVLLHN